MPAETNSYAKPFINVTPLIDVLLVLLIIFLIAAPLKPHDFKVKLPSQPTSSTPPLPDPHTLVITIQPDRTLKLNRMSQNYGTVDNASQLCEVLIQLFNERRKNHVYNEERIGRFDLPEDVRVLRTVFVKAPRSMPYIDVAKVIDALKGTGAEPLGLQLDDLN